MATISLENLTKEYGTETAVDGLDLSVEDGELLCLLGPSGCGKSTTLRMLSGLETPTEGEVYIDGERFVVRSDFDSILSHARASVVTSGSSGTFWIRSWTNKQSRSTANRWPVSG